MADISVTSGYDGLNLPYSPEAVFCLVWVVMPLEKCDFSSTG